MTTCGACGQECSAREGNDGFGHAFGFEDRPVVESSCCEAGVIEDGKPLTVWDVRQAAKDEAGDREFDSRRDMEFEETWEEERRA